MDTNTIRLRGEGSRKRDELPFLCCQMFCDTITKGTSGARLLLDLDPENGNF